MISKVIENRMFQIYQKDHFTTPNIPDVNILISIIIKLKKITKKSFKAIELLFKDLSLTEHHI